MFKNREKNIYDTLVFLMEFDQTFTTDGPWDKVNVSNYGVKGQGHGGIKYVGGGLIVDGVVTTI